MAAIDGSSLVHTRLADRAPHLVPEVPVDLSPVLVGEPASSRCVNTAHNGETIGN